MDERLYYVTVVDGAKYGFLLGPYDTHEEALQQVERGKELANQNDPWACFYGFGTSSLPVNVKQPKTVFGR